ncbi:hypothetical protein ACWGI8_33055, partial [Streptomyces sp. NPDC054841]
MTVRYQHYKGTGKPIYLCQFDGIRNAAPICQTMVGDQIDAAVGELLLTTLTPLTLEVALRVSDELVTRRPPLQRGSARLYRRLGQDRWAPRGWMSWCQSSAHDRSTLALFAVASMSCPALMLSSP